MRVEPKTPSYSSERHGDTPVIDTVAIHDDDAGDLVVFAVNRDLDEEVAFSVGLRAFPGYRLVEHLTISDDDIHAVNTLEQPDRFTPSSRVVSGEADDSVEVVLPTVSWNVLRFERTTS